MVTEIHDWNDLEAVNSDPNGHYVLQNDLDDGDPGYSTHGTEWPGIDIGSDGVFDGAGHHIQEWESNPGDGAGGFFNDIDGEVKDLRMDRFDMNAEGDTTIGGFASDINSGATVKRCQVGPSFADVNTEGRAAGFVGSNSGTIINCAAHLSSVESEEQDVAGFVWTNSETIEKSWAYVTSYEAGEFRSSNGFANSGGTEIDCYYRDNADGDSSSATPLTSFEMDGSSAETNMDELDFQDVWQTEFSGPPTLRDPPEPIVTVDLAATGTGTGTTQDTQVVVPRSLTATGSGAGVGSATLQSVVTLTASGAGSGVSADIQPLRRRSLDATGGGSGVGTAFLDVTTPFIDLSATGSGTGQSDGVQPVRVRSMDAEGDGSGDSQTTLTRRRAVSTEPSTGVGTATAEISRVAVLAASGSGSGDGQAQFVITRDGSGVISSRQNRVVRVTPRQYAELLSRRANTVLNADTIE